MLTALVAAVLVLPGAHVDGGVAVQVDSVRVVVDLPTLPQLPELPHRQRCINCW